jgi:uncharacterized protein YoxC
MLEVGTTIVLRTLQPEVLNGLKTACAGIKTGIETIKTEKQLAMSYINIPFSEAEIRKEAVETAFEELKSASENIIPQDIFRAAPELGVLKDAAMAQLDTLENTVLEVSMEYNSLLSQTKQLQQEIAELDTILDFLEDLVESIDEVLSTPT